MRELAPEPEERAPGDVLVFDKATGTQRYLPPDEATGAFKSGAVNLVSGAPVGVVDPITGEARTLSDPAAIVGEVEKGASLVGADEAHKADLRRQYSGAAGGAMALASGLDTATGGIGSQTAELLGGAYGEDVREALEASDAEHPYLHGAGAIGGAIGQAAILPGAELEQGGRALWGSLTGLKAGAGTFAERAATRAIPLALRAGAEGAIIGETTALSEDALNDGNHRLTGEQLVAATGHGALTGFAMGALTGAAIEGVSTVGKKLAGQGGLLEKHANREMWRDLNAAQTVSRKVTDRVEGGEEAIGATARKIGLDDPRLNPGEQLEIATLSKDETGKEIGNAFRDAGGTGTARPLVERLDAMIADVKKVAGAEGVADGLEKYRDSLLARLSGDVESAGSATAKMDPTELAWFNEEQRLRASVKSNPPDMQEIIEAQANKLKAAREAKFGITKAVDPLDHPVSLQELWEQRKGLDKLLKWESAKDPVQRVELLRNFRSHFQDYLLETGEAAAKGKGEQFAATMKELNGEYSRLSYIEEALETKNARWLSNRRASLTDTIAHAGGMSTAATLLMAGHPIGAVGALASGLANKFARQLGPRLAAWTLGRTAGLEALSGVSTDIDAAIARSATAIYERRKPAEEHATQLESPEGGAVVAEHHKDVEKLEDRYARVSSEVRAASAHPALKHGLTQALEGVSTHAPKIAEQAAQTAARATSYLEQHLPPQAPIDPLRPHEMAPTAPRAMTQWLRRYDAVQDPKAVFAAVGARAVDPIAVDAVRTVYPEMFGRFRMAVATSALEHPEKLTRADRLALSPVVGAPLSRASRAETSASRQAVYAAQASSAPRGGGSRSNTHTGASRETQSQRIEKG